MIGGLSSLSHRIMLSSRRTITFLLGALPAATTTGHHRVNLTPLNQHLTPPGALLIHTCPHRLAGHNKWSKVKNIKKPKDQARSALIAKTLNLMRACIGKTGVSDPANNIELSHLVDFCKRNDIPKLTYLKALQADGSKFNELFLEVRGPQGLLFLVRAYSDKPQKIRQDIKNIVKKRGGSELVTDGVVRRMFEQKAVVSCLQQLTDGSVLEEDQAMDIAILCGAEELHPDTADDGTDIFMFTSDKFQLKNLVSALTEHNLHILSAETPFLPTMPVRCSDEMIEFAANIIEFIKDHPDILEVFDNIESS